jgi:hypothetical protein
MIPTKQTKISRISEFFRTAFALFLFGSKSLWLILRNDIEKNVQTYKEEREQQKKVKNKLNSN